MFCGSHSKTMSSTMSSFSLFFSISNNSGFSQLSNMHFKVFQSNLFPYSSLKYRKEGSFASKDTRKASIQMCFAMQSGSPLNKGIVCSWTSPDRMVVVGAEFAFQIWSEKKIFRRSTLEFQSQSPLDGTFFGCRDGWCHCPSPPEGSALRWSPHTQWCISPQYFEEKEL